MISKSDIIEECLSVDALYFKPDFQITINDCILGTAFDDNVFHGQLYFFSAQINSR